MSWLACISWKPTTSTRCWSSSWLAQMIRVAPVAREPPAGVWLAPRTLNELTVYVADGGTARRVVDDAGDSTATPIRPASSSVTNTAVTEETRLDFSPWVKGKRSPGVA